MDPAIVAGIILLVGIAVLLLLLLPMGMALESISILVISVPLIYPIAMALDFNGIWLGILIVKFIEIGMVTPPVGINCFVVAGTSNMLEGSSKRRRSGSQKSARASANLIRQPPEKDFVGHC